MRKFFVLILALLSVLILADLEILVKNGDLAISLKTEDLLKIGTLEGRVRFQGPVFKEGDENWGEYHVYKGVPLLKILKLVGGMKEKDFLYVIAEDGYYKVIPHQVLQGTTPVGTPILALEEDGKPTNRLIFLSDDGEVSNDDMLKAFGEKLSHYYSGKPSVKGLLVKNIKYLVVNWDKNFRSLEETKAGWKITLEGVRTDEITEKDWEKLVKCGKHLKTMELTVKGKKRVYTGIPLWMVIAMVDGPDDKHPYRFDKTLWDGGYDVTITAADGYTVTFNTKEVAYDSLILAYTEDGKPVKGVPPLRIVGETSKKLWVKNPVEIELDISKKVEKEVFYFELVINGKVHKFTLKELENSPFYVELPGRYVTSAGSVRGGVYGGVKLVDLINQYTSLSAEDTLKAIAMDGYEMTYSGKQILDQKDGYWILAFKKDGEYLPLDPGYIRIIKVGESNPMIEGHLSVRMVKRVEVVKKKYENITLEIKGYMDFTLDRQTLESGISCHGVEVEYKGHVYKGIPLWRLLAYSDDPKYAPHKQDPSIKSYNEELALKGYKVRVIAEDGYSITLDSRDLNKEDGVIIAMYRDGELIEDEGPLVLVWDRSLKIEGIKKVKNVVKIELIF